jgi:hypothetical protein
MAGSAVINTAILGDSLISIADDIRQIGSDLGVRQFRVYLVTSTPALPTYSLNPPTLTLSEITPPPLVKPYRMTFKKEPCGLDEAEFVDLEQVSLSYTEAQLSGTDLAMGAGFYYKITDNYGQGVFVRYFTLAKPAYPDRIKTFGWCVTLKKAADPV